MPTEVPTPDPTISFSPTPSPTEVDSVQVSTALKLTTDDCNYYQTMNGTNAIITAVTDAGMFEPECYSRSVHDTEQFIACQQR